MNYAYCFGINLVTSIIYWVLMYPVVNKELFELIERDNDYRKFMWHIFQHGVPVLYTLSEALFLSQIPALIRHHILLFTMHVAYIIVNVVWTLNSKYPVYPFVTWRSTVGTLLPLSLVPLLFLLQAVLKWIAMCKARCLG